LACSGKGPTGGPEKGANAKGLPAQEILGKEVREALDLYEQTQNQVQASKNPERFLYMFAHRIEAFPPRAEMETLPAKERHRIASLFNGYALALQGTKRINEAEEIFRWVLRMNPNLLPAQFNLAILLFQSGRFQEAEKKFEALLLEDLGDDYRQKTQEWLDQIRRVRARTGR
jgi:tetratricopeptide (TPR) repeat protein